jgi:hypothetical protein
MKGSSMKNRSGSYTPQNKVTVTHWPSPSPEGDGDALIDPATGDEQERDGKTVKQHKLPEGFTERHSRDEHGTVTHRVGVRLTDGGNVKRDKQGNAHALHEGSALVEYADGSVETVDEKDLAVVLAGYGVTDDEEG